MRIGDAHFLAAADRVDQLPPPAFAEIAFGGRSNVGKSSLLNRLMGRRKLVRTSSTPGCTRGIHVYRVELHGLENATVDLIDLPGYGYAKRSKAERRSWGPLVEGLLQGRDHLQTVAVLVDTRRGFEADDRQLIEFLKHLGKTPVCVATKLDKVPASRRAQTMASLTKAAGQKVIGFSATKNVGVDELWRVLLDAASVAVNSETKAIEPTPG